MEESQNNPEQLPIINSPKKRPQMLSFLCVLTFIWSGLSLIIYLYCVLFFEALKQSIPTAKLPPNYEEFRPIMIKLFSNGHLYFILASILAFFSLLGAIKMWKLQKYGFHFYTISQIIMLMLPLIFLKSGSFLNPEFWITAMFVAMYATHLKIMN